MILYAGLTLYIFVLLHKGVRTVRFGLAMPGTDIYEKHGFWGLYFVGGVTRQLHDIRTLWNWYSVGLRTLFVTCRGMIFVLCGICTL